MRVPDKKNYPGKYMRNFQNTRDNTLYIYVYYKRKMKALIDAVLRTYGWIKIDPFLFQKGLTLIPLCSIKRKMPLGKVASWIEIQIR